MRDKPTKKLFKKLDKRVPGFSEIVDLKKIFNLDNDQANFLEFAASLALTIEKASRTKEDRKAFSEITKQMIRIKQNSCCNECGKYSEVLEFHHRNGNRSDNRPSNCEGLCPNCHRKRHRKEKKE